MKYSNYVILVGFILAILLIISVVTWQLTKKDLFITINYAAHSGEHAPAFVGQSVVYTPDGMIYKVPLAKDKSVLGYYQLRGFSFPKLKPEHTYLMTINASGTVMLDGTAALMNAQTTPSYATVRLLKPLTTGKLVLWGTEDFGITYSATTESYDYRTLIIEGFVIGTVENALFRVPAKAGDIITVELINQYMNK